MSKGTEQVGPMEKLNRLGHAMRMTELNIDSAKSVLIACGVLAGGLIGMIGAPMVVDMFSHIDSVRWLLDLSWWGMIGGAVVGGVAMLGIVANG